MSFRTCFFYFLRFAFVFFGFGWFVDNFQSSKSFSPTHWQCLSTYSYAVDNIPIKTTFLVYSASWWYCFWDKDLLSLFGQWILIIIDQNFLEVIDFWIARLTFCIVDGAHYLHQPMTSSFEPAPSTCLFHSLAFSIALIFQLLSWRKGWDQSKSPLDRESPSSNSWTFVSIARPHQWYFQNL